MMNNLTQRKVPITLRLPNRFRIRDTIYVLKCNSRNFVLGEVGHNIGSVFGYLYVTHYFMGHRVSSTIHTRANVKMAEHSIPLDILDDLSSRFIINVPEEERKDLVRICFQIELAHWFYLDFYCAEDNRKLKSCSIKEFATHIFQHIPFLKPHFAHIDSVIEQWREYKQSVPTFGAIVLNDDLTKVLLVQSYWAKHSWGFPKGKVNEDEDPSHCAVREVLEETGFDISDLIDKNEYIESTIHDQLVRLYIISGVQMNTKFKPRTRNEIKNVEWFALADLPNNKKDMTPKVKMGVGPNAFFMVVPFVKRMKRWVVEKQQREKNIPRRLRHKSLGDVETTSKSKRQQQLISQSVQNEIPDFKNTRRLNTSPTRSRRSAFDVKSSQKASVDNKNFPKGAFKRNLFGEPDEDQSAAVLAKQLVDSPRALPPRSVMQDSAIQSIKCTEVNHKTQISANKTKGDRIRVKEEFNEQVTSGNIKSLLFGEAAQKLASDIKDIPSPFGPLQHGNKSPFMRQACPTAQELSLEFNSKIWAHFKFDRQAVLNCF